MYSNAQHAGDPLTGAVTGIRCDINGVTSTVPLDPANSDFRRIMALAEAGELTITPYEPPPATVPTLTRRQLRLGLLQLGVTTAQVETVIATLPEPDRSVAMIEWQDATTYERKHPLVAQIGDAVGLSVDSLDAAWAAASAL